MAKVESLRRNPFLLNRSASETIMRLVLQAATGEVFSERSPAWLRPLRYDAYNEMLRINFEYDGYQHTGYVERWHREEPNALASIRADDREKDRLSIQNGVRNSTLANLGGRRELLQQAIEALGRH